MADKDLFRQLLHDVYVERERTSEKSTVKNWLQKTLVAIVNVLILAFLAAYFRNQELSFLDVISLVADSMGIIIGLLGIWFFFLSEELNRSTAINLEKTTSTINDLRNQMWEMIQKTFNTFIQQESKEKVAATKEEIEQLKLQIQSDGQTKSEDIAERLDRLTTRVSELLNQSNTLVINPLNDEIFKNVQFSMVKEVARTFIINHFKEFPMKPTVFRELIDRYLKSFDLPLKSSDIAFELVKMNCITPKTAKGSEPMIDLTPMGFDVVPEKAREGFNRKGNVDDGE